MCDLCFVRVCPEGEWCHGWAVLVDGFVNVVVLELAETILLVNLDDGKFVLNKLLRHNSSMRRWKPVMNALQQLNK